MCEYSGNIVPEIWGGIECTVNRVNNIFIDQVKLSKHSERDDDLELFASLGIKKIRYPVLWERINTGRPGEYNWRWSDCRLDKLQQLKITPVAGLLHHGSGPAFTNLTDINFPELLADFAFSAASRYPWLEYYTPVNEPLTTARFSCLYGHWFPHYQSDFFFARALINQCRGILLCMEKIRSVNPAAKLVQTEDLGKTYSTEKLHYQAAFENERRWLTYDLLCGKVDKHHYMWNYFLNSGISEKELLFFTEHPEPPFIAGMNYYVTSERYLDHRIKNYPAITPGGNHLHSYADIEAVRVINTSGAEGLLTEAWERFNIPLAVTEAHLSCTREEQLRWFKYIFDTAVNLNRKKIPVKAVTAWSLLGAFDWDSLVTKCSGSYETGVFDIRASFPRKTALFNMIKSFAVSKDYNHPLLEEKGWWNRADRFINNKYIPFSSAAKQPLLITGGLGSLAGTFSHLAAKRGIYIISLPRAQLDITNAEAVEHAVDMYKPWGIINAAGYSDVDKAELQAGFCRHVNTNGVKILADSCTRHGIKLLAFSSNHVFDGGVNLPYTESIPVSPINTYGKSKADAEKYMLKNCPSALIIRSSCFFGTDKNNNLTSLLLNIHEGEIISAEDDIILSPTYLPDLADAALDLFIDDETGIWHLTNNFHTSWFDFVSAAADEMHLNKKLIIPVPANEMNFIAQRASYSALSSERGIILPAINKSLKKYVDSLGGRFN